MISEKNENQDTEWRIPFDTFCIQLNQRSLHEIEKTPGSFDIAFIQLPWMPLRDRDAFPSVLSFCLNFICSRNPNQGKKELELEESEGFCKSREPENTEHRDCKNPSHFLFDQKSPFSSCITWSLHLAFSFHWNTELVLVLFFPCFLQRRRCADRFLGLCFNEATWESWWFSRTWHSYFCRNLNNQTR